MISDKPTPHDLHCDRCGAEWHATVMGTACPNCGAIHGRDDTVHARPADRS